MNVLKSATLVLLELSSVSVLIFAASHLLYVQKALSQTSEHQR